MALTRRRLLLAGTLLLLRPDLPGLHGLSTRLFRHLKTLPRAAAPILRTGWRGTRRRSGRNGAGGSRARRPRGGGGGARGRRCRGGNRSPAHILTLRSLEAFPRGSPNIPGPFSPGARSAPVASGGLEALRPGACPLLGTFRADKATRPGLRRPPAAVAGSATRSNSAFTSGPHTPEPLRHLRREALLSSLGHLKTLPLWAPFGGQGAGLGNPPLRQRPQIRGLDNGPRIAQVPGRGLHVAHLRGPGPVAGIFRGHDPPEMGIALKHRGVGPTAPDIVDVLPSFVVIDGHIIYVSDPGDIPGRGAPTIGARGRPA